MHREKYSFQHGCMPKSSLHTPMGSSNARSKPQCLRVFSPSDRWAATTWPTSRPCWSRWPARASMCTHGEMLHVHAYPELKKHKHYGGSRQVKLFNTHQTHTHACTHSHHAYAHTLHTHAHVHANVHTCMLMHTLVLVWHSHADSLMLVHLLCSHLVSLCEPDGGFQHVPQQCWWCQTALLMWQLWQVAMMRSWICTAATVHAVNGARPWNGTCKCIKCVNAWNLNVCSHACVLCAWCTQC